jgi:competence protein ComEA
LINTGRFSFYLLIFTYWELKNHFLEPGGQKMQRAKKYLSVFCFIGLLFFIFSVLIFTPKLTFAEVSEKVMSEEMINLNTATAEELAQLKGIGEKLAQRIIEYREQHGPFENIEDILQVKGLGENFLEENSAKITVGEEVVKDVKIDVDVKE